jgi:hypothetical protein
MDMARAKCMARVLSSMDGSSQKMDGYGSSQILQLFSNMSSEPELDGIECFSSKTYKIREKHKNNTKHHIIMKLRD